MLKPEFSLTDPLDIYSLFLIMIWIIVVIMFSMCEFIYFVTDWFKNYETNYFDQ